MRLGGVLLLFLNGLFAVMIADRSWHHRDLTAEQEHSLSEGTRRILSQLNDQVIITFVASDKQHNMLKPLVGQVINRLRPMAAVAPSDNLKVVRIDPTHNEADQALVRTRLGIRPFDVELATHQSWEMARTWFAIAVQSGSESTVIPFRDLVKMEHIKNTPRATLNNLEYLVIKAIRKVIRNRRGFEQALDRLPGQVIITTALSSQLPPFLEQNAVAMNEALIELEQEYPGMILSRSVDPDRTPDTARALGIEPLALAQGPPVYMGCLVDTGQQTAQIDLTSRGLTKQSARAVIQSRILSFIPGARRTVGLITPSQPDLDQPPTSAWPAPQFEGLKHLLRQEYSLADLPMPLETIPAHVDALVVASPKDVSYDTVGLLQDFMMRGGGVVVMADHYQFNHQSVTGQFQLSLTPAPSGLEDWLAHCGVRLTSQLIKDQQCLPLNYFTTVIRGGRKQDRVPAQVAYPYTPALQGASINAEHPVTAGLEHLAFDFPVMLDLQAPPQVQGTVLLEGSPHSWLTHQPDDVHPENALGQPQNYLPGAHRRTPLAVCLEGSFPRFRLPAVFSFGSPRPQSPPTRLAVIGDGDFLSDKSPMLPPFGSPASYPDNPLLLLSLIDWCLADDTLLSIRTRGVADRSLKELTVQNIEQLEHVILGIPLLMLLVVVVIRIVARRITAQKVTSL